VILTQKTPFPPSPGMRCCPVPLAPALARCRQGFTGVTPSLRFRVSVSTAAIAPRTLSPPNRSLKVFSSCLSSPGAAGALTAPRQHRHRRQQPPQHRPPAASHAGSGTLRLFPAARCPGARWVPPRRGTAAAPALGTAPRARRFLCCWRLAAGRPFPGGAEREVRSRASLLPKAKEKATQMSPAMARAPAGTLPKPGPVAPHARAAWCAPARREAQGKQKRRLGVFGVFGLLIFRRLRGTLPIRCP